MATPPEVLFDRFFRSRQHLLDEGLLGKVDLDKLTATTFPIALLLDIQAMMNNALLVENTNIPGHVDHDPFHFDYLNANEPNAIAFCADGYSFIGITIQLVDQLWAAGTRLSEVRELQVLLKIRLTDAQRAEMTTAQRIQVVLFRLQFLFVALHEFSHVVHGHIQQGDDSPFASEIILRNGGSIEKQARESDADGYAIYFLLTNVFDSSQERGHLLRLLGKDQSPDADQDEVLFAAFVMAAAAFIFAQAPQTFTEQDLDTRTHPLHAVRLRLMMKAAYAWCDQNRPALCPQTRGPQFHALVRLLAHTICGSDGQARWDEQLQFMRSDAGRQYDTAVETECVRLVRAFGRRVDEQANLRRIVTRAALNEQADVTRDKRRWVEVFRIAAIPLPGATLARGAAKRPVERERLDRRRLFHVPAIVPYSPKTSISPASLRRRCVARGACPSSMLRIVMSTGPRLRLENAE